MNGFGFRLPVVCLIGMGLVACSAAGDPGGAGAATDPTLMLNPPPQSEGEGDGSRPGGSDMPPGNSDPGTDADPGDDDDHDGGTPGGHCDCALDLPGIIIDHDQNGITVSVDLPNIGMVVIETKDGSVSTSAGGVDIKGDVTIDLGADTALPLADAQLHVGLPVIGAPTIQGSANVSGSLLDGIGCGCEGSLLPVSVGLDIDAAANLLNSDAPAAITLGLALPTVTLDSSDLPAAADLITLVDANVDIATDGCSKLLEIDAKVDAGADAWTSLVPIAAAGDLNANVKLLDGSLASITLDGDVKLKGDALVSGATKLLSLELPDAVVTLDNEGASLLASTTASLHPSFSLTGEALVDGKFTQDDWSLNVCGAVMTNLLGGGTTVNTCLDIGKNGVTPCRLPTN